MRLLLNIYHNQSKRATQACMQHQLTEVTVNVTLFHNFYDKVSCRTKLLWIWLCVFLPFLLAVWQGREVREGESLCQIVVNGVEVEFTEFSNNCCYLSMGHTRSGLCNNVQLSPSKMSKLCIWTRHVYIISLKLGVLTGGLQVNIDFKISKLWPISNIHMLYKSTIISSLIHIYILIPLNSLF